LTGNRVWKQRLVDVGLVSPLDALSYGFSGVMLRGSGFLWDLRMVGYEVYSLIDFSVPVGFYGDCFDRFLLRIEEMRQSLYILLQVLEGMPYGFVKADDYKITPPSRKRMKKSSGIVDSSF
jgi:NADH dehydrogenase (ubiquinone) Fe-S protein 2